MLLTSTWFVIDFFSCSSLGTSDIFSGRPPLVSPLKLAEAGLVADPDLAFQYGLIDYDEANIDRIRNWEDRRAVLLQWVFFFDGWYKWRM